MIEKIFSEDYFFAKELPNFNFHEGFGILKNTCLRTNYPERNTLCQTCYLEVYDPAVFIYEKRDNGEFNRKIFHISCISKDLLEKYFKFKMIYLLGK